MATSNKSLIRSLLSAAGCGCGRPKTSDAYQPIPVHKTVKTDGGGGEEADGVKTSSVAGDTSASSITRISTDDDPNPKIADSVAVMKDSDDPFRDFRDSMVQMISEKELGSRDDLEELLNCFLEINSPRHYDVIFRAFADVWNHMDESGRVVPGRASLPTE